MRSLRTRCPERCMARPFPARKDESTHVARRSAADAL